MPTPEDAKQRAAFTYNAAADVYDDSPLSFWDYFGKKTVDKLSLQTGAHVLDVCCGSGASAIPAAEMVGPSGLVIGVDLADQLLELARAKARRRFLKNISFQCADMLALDYPGESFDAVICVFGIFFVPDMSSAVRELWHFVRPSGKLAITTWGPNVLEPGNGAFWRAVLKVRPELHKAFNPWERINDPDNLRRMLGTEGVDPEEVIAENRCHALTCPEDWWTIALGSGYRGTIEQLSAAERVAVREANLNFIRDHGIVSLETNALYAVATKKTDPAPDGSGNAG
jgi:ubiquinone/menaquinone biosynthesis C-methylase UbiE